MLFERQRLLLHLLDAFGGSLRSTDFQKQLFLYTREWEETPSYDFVPYHFGCFSFTCGADQRRLTERGLLVEEERRWMLTPTGRQAVAGPSLIRERAARFAEQSRPLRGDRLIAEVYRRHPYYATRSRIVSRVLKSPADRQRVKAAQPSKKMAGLVTLGYEGRSLECFLNELLQDSVTLLCDVRRNPISRKYGFSKGTLSKACEGVGLRYLHLPELGIASEARRNLETQADYDALFADYRQRSLPHQDAALAQIRELIRQGERVALTCYEAKPCQCHRHCVAEALEKNGKGGLLTTHL